MIIRIGIPELRGHYFESLELNDSVILYRVFCIR